MPAVAEHRATAPGEPVYCARAASNSALRVPVVIQPERSTSVTAAMSASIIDGRENGRNSVIEKFAPETMVDNIEAVYRKLLNQKYLINLIQLYPFVLMKQII